MDSLERFLFYLRTFSNPKKGWKKIGLWIPLFFSNKKNIFCFLKRRSFYMILLNDFVSQISKFEKSKKARRR